MTPVEQLLKEHEQIVAILDIADAVAAQIQSGQELDTRRFNLMIEFIKGYVLDLHIVKEEVMFFYALEEGESLESESPFGQILREHLEVKRHIQTLAGGKTGASAIVRNIQDLTTLFRRHITDEEKGSYPLAEKRISQQKQRELVEEFTAVEQSRIGERKLKTLAEMFAELKGAL